MVPTPATHTHTLALLLLLLLTLTPATTAQPDPTCSTGLISRDICCPTPCGICGGTDCFDRFEGNGICCRSRIRRTAISCNDAAPPCIIPPTPEPTSVPDPTCTTGIISRDICCPMGCGTCGGTGCFDRFEGNGVCCRSRVRRTGVSCTDNGPPCVIQPSPSPSPSPSPPPPPFWKNLTAEIDGSFVRRSEACMVMAAGRVYMIGGRGLPRTSVFDPVERTWRRLRQPPVVLNHMQCVAVGARIWVVNAWFGGFPFEQNHEFTWVYDTVTDSWDTRPALPEPRRRGGGAAVLFDNKIYSVGGNRGGHGEHATTLGYVDVFDLATETWVTDGPPLPDLPDARDHVGGAVVNGDKLCVAGGRDSGQTPFFNETVLSTWCFTFGTRTWTNMNADIPEGRAGAATGMTCEGHLMVAGGESMRRAAFDRVDVFDGRMWRTVDALNGARHGIGLAVAACPCGQIFTAAGAASRGGGRLRESTEVYLPDGRDVICEVY